ncbi:MAG: hypothetical protein JWM25_687 [Thermoleophilia bacterium]|nr:hypothetical protein [Thermoleophilia bacterium]MCZ4496104.1 hypothetical protein [Thermoleophilia bacterium]
MLPDARTRTGKPLLNEEATSAPRSGWIGVLPVEELPRPEGVKETDELYTELLDIAVQCPDCTNYARIEGIGSEFRNITKMLDPVFGCSVCSWGPSEHDNPEKWQVYYAGRLEGAMVFAMNEEHMAVLVEYLETPPIRRNTVEYPWEYRALMGRLPRGMLSGKFRGDMVSLVKRLQRTRPHGI